MIEDTHVQTQVGWEEAGLADQAYRLLDKTGCVERPRLEKTAQEVREGHNQIVYE